MVEELEIKVDLGKLTIGDLETLNNAQIGETILMDLLDKAVVGGARNLPLLALRKVIDAIKEAIRTIMNPVDAQGKA